MAEIRFDVLVVGGGITGAGIALDAAARGFSVALVERRDFASGTSGRSSRRHQRTVTQHLVFRKESGGTEPFWVGSSPHPGSTARSRRQGDAHGTADLPD